MRQELEYYRKKNEVSLAPTAKCVVPAAFAFGCAITGNPVFLAIAAVLAVIAIGYGVQFWRQRPKLIVAAQTEFKSGDYPLLSYWIPVIAFVAPIAGDIANIPSMLNFEPSPLLTAVSAGTYYSLVCALGIPHSLNLVPRVGRRRIRQALHSGDSLEDVSVPSLDAVEKDHHVVAGMIAAGAVDGNSVKLEGLATLLEWEVSAVQEAVARLQQAGMVQSNIFKEVTLTPAGIRNAIALGRR